MELHYSSSLRVNAEAAGANLEKKCSNRCLEQLPLPHKLTLLKVKEAA
jgi:hypothetical protein